MTLDPESLRRRVRERLREQRALVQSLLSLREQLQGSLFVRYGECGKEACACRQGRRHGPYYVLSLRTEGKGGFAYLDPERMAQARVLVSRHKDFRAGMRRLKRLNAELVVLLRRYQAAMAQAGGRRIGVQASA
jgi:hypothetical protein